MEREINILADPDSKSRPVSLAEYLENSRRQETGEGLNVTEMRNRTLSKYPELQRERPKAEKYQTAFHISLAAAVILPDLQVCWDFSI